VNARFFTILCLTFLRGLESVVFMTMQRIENPPAKRILAIHDLCGFGSTSLMVVIPIFSRFGIRVCALPTALLSANTLYPGAAWQDTDAFMAKSIAHWKAEGMNFDAIYSGFLGNPQQAELVASTFDMLSEGATGIVVDPVMADDGELYSCYDTSMIDAMRSLVAKADFITPNYTEALMLCGMPYQGSCSNAKAIRLCHSLARLGAKNVIITGVPVSDSSAFRVYHYCAMADSLNYFDCKYLPYSYPGTGDIFASMLLAKIISGNTMRCAIETTISFIRSAISGSMHYGIPLAEGVFLERFLSTGEED